MTSSPPLVRPIHVTVDNLPDLQFVPASLGLAGCLGQADMNHAVLGIVLVDNHQKLFAFARLLPLRELPDRDDAGGAIADVAEDVFSRDRLNLGLQPHSARQLFF